MTSSNKRWLAGFALAATLVPGDARAQTAALAPASADPGQASSQLPWESVVALKPNTRVWVTTFEGSRLDGRFVEARADSLTVLVDDKRRDFSPAAVDAIWRRENSVVNGLVFGAVGGFMVGGFAGSKNDPGEGMFWRELVRSGFLGSLIGAGLGVAVDAAIPGKRLVYRAGPKSVRLVVSPVFLRAGAAVSMSARF